MEGFKPIKDYPKYEMNAAGIIRNIQLNMEVKLEGDYVRLMQNGNRKRVKIAELETTDEVQTEKKKSPSLAIKQPGVVLNKKQDNQLKKIVKQEKKKAAKKQPKSEKGGSDHVSSEFKADDKVKFKVGKADEKVIVKGVVTYTYNSYHSGKPIAKIKDADGKVYERYFDKIEKA